MVELEEMIVPVSYLGLGIGTIVDKSKANESEPKGISGTVKVIFENCWIEERKPVVKRRLYKI